MTDIRFLRPRSGYVIELHSPIEDSLYAITRPSCIFFSERKARRYCRIKNAAEKVEGSTHYYTYTKLDTRS